MTSVDLVNHALWVPALLEWFSIHQRTMPWRTHPIPYYVWISEMMLQQTQVVTVLPYFDRFIKRFPTIHDLASADIQEVLKQWEGLGYYSRARNLHKTARELVLVSNGEFPVQYEALMKLSGIGPYIAAAVASIAFDVPVPVVDGNVLRVFARLVGFFEDIRNPKVRDIIFQYLSPIITHYSPSQFNQSLMELGALICKPTRPLCNDCPIQSTCYAYNHQKIDVLPFKSSKLPIPHIEVGVGIIWNQGRILIAKRKDTQMLGGLWEFPGGRRLVNKTLSETVLEKIKSETDLDVGIDDTLMTISHAFTHFKMTLTAFTCRYLQGTARPFASQSICWVLPEQLVDYPFSSVGKKIQQVLVSHIH